MIFEKYIPEVKRILHMETEEEKFNRICKEKYCKTCSERTENCFVDYDTGKCFLKPSEKKEYLEKNMEVDINKNTPCFGGIKDGTFLSCKECKYHTEDDKCSLNVHKSEPMDIREFLYSIEAVALQYDLRLEMWRQPIGCGFIFRFYDPESGQYTRKSRTFLINHTNPRVFIIELAELAKAHREYIDANMVKCEHCGKMFFLPPNTDIQISSGDFHYVNLCNKCIWLDEKELRNDG